MTNPEVEYTGICLLVLHFGTNSGVNGMKPTIIQFSTAWTTPCGDSRHSCRYRCSEKRDKAEPIRKFIRVRTASAKLLDNVGGRTPVQTASLQFGEIPVVAEFR